jgi:hypothetical protein
MSQNNTNDIDEDLLLSRQPTLQNCDGEMVDRNAGGSEKAVTVQGVVKRLDGIRIIYNKNTLIRRPLSPSKVTAAVGFSGSSMQMHVGSSTVCGISGHLIVESQPICISKSDDSVAGTQQSTQQFSAYWDGNDNNQTMNTVNVPHLTMKFTTKAQRPIGKPMNLVNRGAQVVSLPSSDELKPKPTDTTTDTTTTATTHTTTKISPSVDDTETIAKEDKNYIETKLEKDEDCRSRSAVWSDNTAILPEIIELYVKLRHKYDDDDGIGAVETTWEGVAFLVLYGHEQDMGVHCIQLPVQSLSCLQHDPSEKTDHGEGVLIQTKRTAPQTSHAFRLAEDAHLTIQIKIELHAINNSDIEGISPVVVPDDDSIPDPRKCQPQILSKAELESVLRKLHHHEQLAQQMRENQRRAMCVHVPHNYMVPGAPLPRPPPPPSPPMSDGCTMPILGEWVSALSRVAQMITTSSCGPPTMSNDLDDDDSSSVLRNEIHDDDDSSTIATKLSTFFVHL